MLAYLLFMRRDFTSLAHDGSGRRVITWGILPMAGLIAATVGIVALATGATGSGIEQGKVQQSLATEFAHLYRLQSSELNHMDVTEAQLHVTASCTKGDGIGGPPRDPETTGAATSTGISPASMPRVTPFTSSTSTRTGGTSPTATDRRK